MNKNDNVNNSTHIVRVKDYYPMDCSGQEFMEISDELYNDLEKNKKTEETRKRVERRRIAKIRFDDEGIGSINEIFSDSVEDEFFATRDIEQIEEVKKIISTLTKCQRYRVYLRIVMQLSYKEISELEGVGITTVETSYEQGIEKLKKYGDIVQNIAIKGWLELLI